MAAKVAVDRLAPPSASPRVAAIATPAAAVDEPPPVVARLSDGLELTLTAVSEHTKNPDKRWYAPGGRPLPYPPYESAYPGSVFVWPHDVGRDFAFEYDPKRLTIKPDANAMSAATVRLSPNRTVPRDAGNHAVRGTDTDSRDVASIFAASLSVPPDQPVKLVFDIASGPWVTRVASRPDAETQAADGDGLRRTLFTTPFEDEGNARVGYAAKDFGSGADVRLVAVDTDRHLHLPENELLPYRPPAERRAEPVLDVMLPARTFDAVSFGEIVRWLRDDVGVAVEVDWPGLKASTGVDESTPVTGDVSAQQLYFWMDTMLSWVGVAPRGKDVRFDVKNGVVKIYAAEPGVPPLVYYSVPRLPLAKLQRFEVQTRAFDRWVAFDNVSPTLGAANAVTVRTSDDPPTAAATRPAVPGDGSRLTFADGTSVELLAVGDGDTGDCWLPDGTPCDPPFDDRPRPVWRSIGPMPGTRRLWLLTLVRRPDGRYGSGDGRLLDTITLTPGRGMSAIVASNQRKDGDVRFQTQDVFLPSDMKTLTWQTRVNFKEPRRATIYRGPTGWDPAAVARVSLGDSVEAVLWQPTDQPRRVLPNGRVLTTTNMTTARVWLPPTLGPAWDATLKGKCVDGTEFSGNLSMGGVNPFGAAYVPLDALQSLTLVVTHYDHEVTFRDVSLCPGVRTKASATQPK